VVRHFVVVEWRKKKTGGPRNKGKKNAGVCWNHNTGGVRGEPVGKRVRPAEREKKEKGKYDGKKEGARKGRKL